MKKATDHSTVILWREAAENRLVEAASRGYFLSLKPLSPKPTPPDPSAPKHEDLPAHEFDHAPLSDPVDKGELLKLTADIERAILARTGRMIRHLRVVLSQESIVLQGNSRSYYYKQLAQHAAMSLLQGERLHNAILVD